MTQAHTCHAIGCTLLVKPELLMCRQHWMRVPKPLQRAVWAHYREGQCDDKQPSRAWFLAAETAICHVAVLEGRMTREEANEKLRRMTRDDAES